MSALNGGGLTRAELADCVVIIPFRDSEPLPDQDHWTHRGRALEFVRERWHRLGLPVNVVRDTNLHEPWRKGAAINSGAHACLGRAKTLGLKIAIVSDADVWCEQRDVIAAVANVRAGAAWAMPHTWVNRLNPDATAATYAGRLLPREWLERRHRGHAGGGMVVLPLATLVECPPDPRFAGWGRDDDAWAYELDTLAPGSQRTRGTGAMVHLWHPPQDGAARSFAASRESETLYERYARARGNPAHMRALINEWRADGLPLPQQQQR